MGKTRTKSKQGQYLTKRYDTEVKTIEEKYGVDLGVPGNMKLGNYLKKKGYKSLSELLHS